MDATKPAAAAEKILTRLTIVACPTCGVAFGLPTGLYLARLGEKGGAITCPNGHANPLAGKAAKGDWFTLYMLASAEASRLENALRTAEGELEQLRPPPGPPQPPSEEEIQRRVRVLAEAARRVVGGSGLARRCRFCGKGCSDLRRHLLRNHKAEIAAAPVAMFAEM
jgi:hypothetical protein